MSARASLRQPVFASAAVGTFLQLIMVVLGHFVRVVANLFGLLGITISFLAGWLLGRWAPGISRGQAAGLGALVGGVSALIGIAASYGMGDVDAVIFLVGTLSSAVTGLLGGIAGRRG